MTDMKIVVTVLFCLAAVPAVPSPVRAGGTPTGGALRKETTGKKRARAHGGMVDATTGMEFVTVPGGCFQMGDATGKGNADERPLHKVCVDPFAIGTYEVTQGEWKRVMGTDRSNFAGCPDCPVEMVSWDDAQEFIRTLNTRSGTHYRLPTEAEWEYACRSGGKNEKYCGGKDVLALSWYYWTTDGKTYPVGGKRPNGLGIYDMSGNVSEWVQDWYGDYPAGEVHNPSGPETGTVRVNRGGCWINYAGDVRATARSSNDPDYHSPFIGFRLVAPVR